MNPRRPLGLFCEYWQNPEENAARFQGDWYLTGDRARRDAQGRYWFVGRSDDVIKSAGYRIGPFEVESALVEHPAVVEAAVVAQSDAIRGAIVKAFVVLRKDVVPSEALGSANCRSTASGSPRLTNTRAKLNSSPNCRKPLAARSGA